MELLGAARPSVLLRHPAAGAREAHPIEAQLFRAGDSAPSPDPRPDAVLIGRAQRGDRSAFSALMDLYRERVVRLALHMVGNADDAQDLCQETFVRVFRALDSFDGSRAFSPWLYRIAHNVILDFLRRRKVRPVVVEPNPEHPYDEGPDPAAVNPLQSLISKEVGREVIEAVKSLPDNYRTVMIFRYLDDLSYSEIAETLGLTEANVMMRMSRARRMLRERLKHLHSEDELL